MATSLSLTFFDEATAKWRETIGKTPIEQSQLGNKFLDTVSRDFSKSVSPSGHLQFPVRFRSSTSGAQWYDDGDVGTVSTPQEVTMADQAAANVKTTCHIWRTEKNRVAGSNPRPLFDLMAERLNSMVQRCKNAVASEIMATSATAKRFVPLPVMAPQAPSGTTLHGISQTTHTGWANQVEDFGGGAISSNLDQLDLLIEKCRKYGEAEPTHIIVTRATKLALIKAAWSKTEIQVMPGRVGDGRAADLSFRQVFYQGLEVVDDQYATAAILHVVSRDALCLLIDPTQNFRVEGPFDLRPTQEGFAWHCYMTGAFVAKERSALGHGYNFTEA